jgi:hypothetical protein
MSAGTDAPFDGRFDVGGNPKFAVCRVCRMRCHADWEPNDHHCDNYVAAVSTRWPVLT